MTRSFMIEQLGRNMWWTARVKGLSWARTVWVHAFRNVAVAGRHRVALSYAFLLEGRRADRDGVRMAGFRPLLLTNALLAGDMNAVVGLHHPDRRDLHRHQHRLRPAVPGLRPRTR